MSRANFGIVQKAVESYAMQGFSPAFFLDPDAKQIEAAHNAGAQQVEFCTAEYAE
jgi:pyridoxine 5'-phosphate synthase PdxJ